MSGLAPKSMAVGPAELNPATASSAVSYVPCVLNAHTVSTHGAMPGDVIAPQIGCPALFNPKLPAAATTTMPRSTSALAASVSGSSQYDTVTGAPTDMLTTRTFACGFSQIQ